MAILQFDPVRVGQLEARWWRADHDHNRQLLLKSLVEEHIELYELSEDNAQKVLGFLAQAVQLHQSRQWEEVTQMITKYYKEIKRMTGLSYDPQEVAKLEVAWWRLHDELEHTADKSRLAKAFSTLYAALFGIPKESLLQAGRTKAEAAREHDLAEDPRTSPKEAEDHWQKAGQLLISFYQELQRVLKTP